MAKFLIAILPAVVLFASPAISATGQNRLIESKIVGGIQAQPGDWPFMSALVFDSVSSTLRINNVLIDSLPFSFSPSANVNGALMDCGIGDAICADATGKVCLISRGEINFSVKVENCEAGGGVGAVIYNNVDGELNGTLGEDFAGTIPAVSVTQQQGNTLLGQLGDTATIASTLSQESTCGASFLGDKWVLTAAHCVEDGLNQYRKVNVGEYDLSNGAENAVSIKHVYIHPEYDNVSLDNDIALIELVESVDGTAVVLASKATTNNAATDNSYVTVMGWGGTTGYAPGEGPTSGFPDKLRQVELNTMTNTECSNTIADASGSSPSSVGITDQMICAGVPQGGKSSCQGDSGGPLVINTNEGWQQLGVVSWGIGCAAAGYPGVFARVAEFEQWLQAISQGIAIEQTVDFHIIPVGYESVQIITVTNNSTETTALNFSVSGSNKFTLDTSECAALNAGDSCDLTVSYSSNTIGKHQATINISADVQSVQTSQSSISGQTIASSSTINTTMGTDSNFVNWYSGGDLAWVNNTVAGGIESGAISDLQDSIVMAVISGEGELTFEWAVSSEENIDDPDDPFDALYLYVDGVEIEFISGEVDFEEKSISFEADSGEHTVVWLYHKDPYTSEFDDKGYLRNVVFTPAEGSTTPTPLPTPTPTPEKSSSSGGSLAWLSLLLLAVLAVNRKMIRN